MSQAHLQALKSALARRSWEVNVTVSGGESRLAATWEIRRGRTGPKLLIDFAGLGPMGEDIPLEESYACVVRGRHNLWLYFRRVNHSRKLWLAELSEFVASLNQVSVSE